MLDDLKLIHERDAQDALGITEKSWQQLDFQFPITDLRFSDEIHNIVCAGMGGSALAAQMSLSWPGYDKAQVPLMNKVLNEADVMPVERTRLTVQTAKLLRKREKRLLATKAGQALTRQG